MGNRMPLIALILMRLGDGDEDVENVEWVVQEYWFDCGFLHWRTHNGYTAGKSLDQFTDYFASDNEAEVARILAAEEKEE